jgi:predicted ABC-type ATPase
VFAGPNGSGKSSIIKSILNTEVKKGKKLDFGIYINADDIAVELSKNGCNFSNYTIESSKTEILDIANRSGLINEDFPIERFDNCISFKEETLQVNNNEAQKIDDNPFERIAQILADFLRKNAFGTGQEILI